MSDQNAKNKLNHLNTLMSGASSLYKKLVKRYAQHLGFIVETEQQDEQLIIGPDNRVYTVLHRLHCWNSSRYGRWIWFILDSQIPHVSSIVASMGLSSSDETPLFVMNLNLKMHLNVYNTIIGYRGQSPLPRFLDKFIPKLLAENPQPLMQKDNPRGFSGLRLVFQLEDAPIHWSLEKAEEAISGWFHAATFSEHCQKPINRENLEKYKQEMLKLHDVEGSAFDAIFGQGWISDMFKNKIFR